MEDHIHIHYKRNIIIKHSKKLAEQLNDSSVTKALFIYRHDDPASAIPPTGFIFITVNIIYHTQVVRSQYCSLGSRVG